jgi:protocatechuate 3,4-dioxygenase beta subunit
MYFVVKPKTLWRNKPEFGEWAAVTDENGYVTFNTIDEARAYGESLGGEFYVVQIVG